MLPKSHRLRRSGEINKVRQSDRSWRHPLVIMLAEGNAGSVSRFAVVASRRVGHAVARNRAKRCLREAIRLHLSDISPGWNCVFVIRRKMTQATFDEIDEAVLRLLARAELLHQNKSVQHQG